MRITQLDHLVLTVADVGATTAFYERIGMRRETFAGGRTALHFGCQKLNLHLAGEEISPHALRPVPGSADLCFLIEGRLADIELELCEAGIEIELGPVERTGARRALRSLSSEIPTGTWLSSPRKPVHERVQARAQGTGTGSPLQPRSGRG